MKVRYILEKTYLTIKKSGVLDIIIGVTTIIAGVMLILNGTKSLKECTKLLF